MAKAVPRNLPALLAALTLPVLLSGCFAMEKDLEPVRSDVSILEKQFVDMSRDVKEMKRQAGEGADVPQQVKDGLKDSQARLSAIEKRLDRLEAQLKEQRQAQTPQAPQPVAPEPVVITPLEEAPKAPPAGR